MLSKSYYIDHNSGNPGELLSVSISTENMQFGAFSTIPQFKLVPTSYVANTGASEVTGIFTSFLNDSINTVTDTSSTNDSLFGDIFIPVNQPAGFYNLQVYSVHYNMWISLDSAFYVNDIIYGCTDAIASNYNPAASVDNGSCMITLCDSSNYNGPEEVLFTKLPYVNHHNINSRDVINASMQYQLTRNNLNDNSSNNINGIYGVWGLFNYLSQIDASDNISNSGILYAYGDLASNSAFQGQYPFVGTNFNGCIKIYIN